MFLLNYIVFNLNIEIMSVFKHVNKKLFDFYVFCKITFMSWQQFVIIMVFMPFTYFFLKN